MIGTVTLSLAQGFLITLKLFTLTLLFSLPLGLFMALGVSGFKIISYPLKLLIWVHVNSIYMGRNNLREVTALSGFIS